MKRLVIGLATAVAPGGCATGEQMRRVHEGMWNGELIAFERRVGGVPAIVPGRTARFARECGRTSG